MLKTLGHKQSVSNLISKGPTDLVLVSDCGSKVASHSLLIALNSPKMAKLLLETETNTAISLPFPISIVSALASALISRQKGKGVEGLEEAAASREAQGREAAGEVAGVGGGRDQRLGYPPIQQRAHQPGQPSSDDGQQISRSAPVVNQYHQQPPVPLPAPPAQKS